VVGAVEYEIVLFHNFFCVLRTQMLIVSNTSYIWIQTTRFVSIMDEKTWRVRIRGEVFNSALDFLHPNFRRAM